MMYLYPPKKNLQTVEQQDLEAQKVHFAVMAIGAAADLMGITPSALHRRLERAGIVRGLLFDFYDVGHTQSLKHVAEDVVEALKNRENQYEEK